MTSDTLRALRRVKHELDGLLRNSRRKDGRSKIWSEGCGAIRYVRHLPPEELLKIRLHVGMFTGENVFQFWHPPQPIDPAQYAESTGYRRLTEGLPRRYWAGEPSNASVPVPLGVKWRGRVLNKDIARFQSCLSNLIASGAMRWLLRRRQPVRVIEIGGGYGGFAYQLRRNLRRPSTVFLVDFAEMLYFPAAYLSAADPRASVRILRPDGSNLRSALSSDGYVLVPLESLPILEEQDWDLAVNLMSFQEMTPEVVTRYLRLIHKGLRGFFYSYNMERHPHNRALRGKSLTDSFAKFFRLFPDPSVYADPSLGSNHPWYYRSYLGWKRGGEAQFDERPEWWLREYRAPQSHRGVGHHPQFWKRYRPSAKPAI